MASIEELKEIIIDLKMNLIDTSIPDSNCPYAYYRKENPFSCGSVSCERCRSIFMEIMRKDVMAEVEQL